MLDALPEAQEDQGERRVCRRCADFSVGAGRNPEAMTRAESAQKRCYPPKTLFRASASSFVTADMLALGDRVLDMEGTMVEVVWAWAHGRDTEAITVLTTKTTQLRVTNSHLVVKQSVRGTEVVRAEDVETGDWIIVGNRPEQVSVQREFMDTATIELGFENDASVEAWSVSDYGIATKGQPVDFSYAAATQCKEEESEDDQPATGTREGAGAAAPWGSGAAEGGGRRCRRSRRRHDRTMSEIRRARSPNHDFD